MVLNRVTRLQNLDPDYSQCWSSHHSLKMSPSLSTSRPPRLEHAASSVWHDRTTMLCLDDTIFSFKFPIILHFFRKPFLELSDSVMLLCYRFSLHTYFFFTFPLPINSVCDNLLPINNHILKPSQGQGLCECLSISESRR